jgi:hypothetical protein
MSTTTKRNIIGIFGKSKSGKNTVGDMVAASCKGTTQIAFADKLKQVCMELFGLTSQDLNTDEGKAKPTSLPCPTCPMCRSINVVAAPTMLAFASFYDQPVVNHKGPRQAECKACGAVGSPDSFVGFWTPRMILQHVGTEGVRRVDPLAWARHTMKTAIAALDANAIRKTGDSVPRVVVVTDGRFRSELDAVRAAGGIAWRLRRPETDDATAGIAGHVSEVEIDGIPDGDFDEVITNDGSLDDLLHAVKAALAPPRAA